MLVFNDFRDPLVHELGLVSTTLANYGNETWHAQQVQLWLSV